MAQVEVKTFDSPDETREFEGNGRAQVVNIAGQTVGRGTFEPGWKWSSNVKPIAKTDSCEVSHLGYVLSGQMRIFMDDGSEVDRRLRRVRGLRKTPVDRLPGGVAGGGVSDEIYRRRQKLRADSRQPRDVARIMRPEGPSRRAARSPLQDDKP